VTYPLKLVADLSLDCIEVRRDRCLDRRDGGGDGLELPIGVGDEGVDEVEHLLLVVRESALVLLLRVGLEDLIESLGFRREILHELRAAARRKSGGIFVSRNLQIVDRKWLLIPIVRDD
jgi:hypothetical protein